MREENTTNIFPFGIDPSPNYVMELAKKQLIKEIPLNIEQDNAIIDQTEESPEQ